MPKDATTSSSSSASSSSSSTPAVKKQQTPRKLKNAYHGLEKVYIVKGKDSSGNDQTFEFPFEKIHAKYLYPLSLRNAVRLEREAGTITKSRARLYCQNAKVFMLAKRKEIGYQGGYEAGAEKSKSVNL